MRENQHVLALIDDDPKILELTASYLRDQEFTVYTGKGGKDLDEILKKYAADLIILDLMMPEESGLQICQRLRVNEVVIPIIMLTAKGDEVDRIVGLEMGADDYLPKPFNPRELLARINAIIRRKEKFSIKSSTKTINFGNFIFDIQNRSLSKKGKNISITTGEFNLLKVFTERPKQPLSRDQIMQLARGKELDVFDRSIDVQISRIRKLIEDDANNPKYLQTKWGFGYIFNPDGE
ncbi:MAG: two-component system phosphate regulon response regulator OmpR [Methylophilaceae bacterium]|jgi:two-component system phosphate regulon response regulator OmpR|tara:strand:- start:416 stop:1123 length:708 start_codon:yes stop_codon:yes gene_type:complete